MARHDAPGGSRETGGAPGDASSAGLRASKEGTPNGHGGKEAQENARARQGHAEYDDIRSSQLESSARLRYLVDNIYVQHGMPPVMQGFDMLHKSRLQRPSLSWAHVLFSARYLVLELWDFEDVYSVHYGKIVGGLDVTDKRGLHMIISGHESVKSALKGLRDKCVAHMERDFGEFAKSIDAVGLASIVHYARAVVMFQDAVFRTIGNRHRKENKPHGGIPISFELPAGTDRQAFEKKYCQADLAAYAGSHRHECEVMRNLQMSLGMLYASFYEAALQSRYRNRGEFSWLDMQVYGSKYMILDIHNFIVEFGKLGIGKTTRPGFLTGGTPYARLRNDYAAHTRVNKIAGVGGLLDGNPGLLGDMLLDIVEIDVLAFKILERHPDTLIKEITRVTPEQFAEIDRRLSEVQVASHEPYGNRYVEPGAGRGALP